MKFFLTLGQVLLSEWLWSVTWGPYHMPINILLMFFLFKIFLRINIVPAVLIAFFSQLFSFIVYTLFVVGFLIVILGIEYRASEHISLVPEAFNASLFLGIIYAVLQGCFFLILSRHYTFNVVRAASIAFLSNYLSALSVYWLLPLY